MAKTRPVGIVILACLNFLLGALCTGTGLRQIIVQISAGLIEGGIPVSLLLLPAVGVVAGFVGGLAMLRGSPWSWYLSSFIYLSLTCTASLGIYLLVRAPEVATENYLRSLGRFTATAILIGLVSLGLVAYLYLLWKKARRHFDLHERSALKLTALQVLICLAAASPVVVFTERDLVRVHTDRVASITDGGISSPDDLHFLIERFQAGTLEERAMAAYALGKTKEPEAVQALRLAAGEDPRIEVRVAAVEAIGPFVSDEIQSDLVAYLEDGSKEVRIAALKALAREEYADAYGSVGRSLQDSDDAIRGLAAEVLGRMRNLDAVPLLLAAAGESQQAKDVNVRLAFALGRLGDSRATPTLIEMLDADSWEVRANAAQALGMIGDAEARSGLKRMLQDSHTQVRYAAEAALEKLR